MKSRTRNFRNVIDVFSTDQDWRRMIVEIAKNHPMSVIKAAAEVNGENSWQKEARRLYLEEGKKIDAIKYCRNRTGMGLKEAKDAVEAL